MKHILKAQWNFLMEMTLGIPIMLVIIPVMFIAGLLILVLQFMNDLPDHEVGNIFDTLVEMISTPYTLLGDYLTFK